MSYARIGPNGRGRGTDLYAKEPTGYHDMGAAATLTREDVAERQAMYRELAKRKMTRKSALKAMRKLRTQWMDQQKARERTRRRRKPEAAVVVKRVRVQETPSVGQQPAAPPPPEFPRVPGAAPETIALPEGTPPALLPSKTFALPSPSAPPPITEEPASPVAPTTEVMAPLPAAPAPGMNMTRVLLIGGAVAAGVWLLARKR